MDDLLLTCPLSIAYIVVVGLVTFGADDFLDFINAYFIEMAIAIFERTYLGSMSDVVFEYLENKLPKQINAIY